MASITIRKLDDTIKTKLRMRAAEHGRSMEEEAREILRQVVGNSSENTNFGATIHARFAALGGFDLPQPARTAMRPAPKFD